MVVTRIEYQWLCLVVAHSRKHVWHQSQNNPQVYVGGTPLPRSVTRRSTEKQTGLPDEYRMITIGHKNAFFCNGNEFLAAPRSLVRRSLFLSAASARCKMRAHTSNSQRHSIVFRDATKFCFRDS